MNRTMKTILCLLGMIGGMIPLFSQLALEYQSPPAEIMALADVVLPPQVLLSHRGERAVLLYRDQYRSIEELSQPELRLAGLRINPKTFTPSRMRTVSRMTLLDLRTGEEIDISGLPSSPRLSYFQWSPDEERLAFTQSAEKGLELWVLELRTACASRLADDCLNGALGMPYVWFQNGKALLAKVHPVDRLPLVNAASAVPTGPTVSVNDGQKAQNMTFQDLLKNRNDEFNFEQAVRSELASISLNGKRSRWKAPAMYRDMSVSPDGRYVLLTEMSRPFSYIVPHYRFPHKVVVCDIKGKPVKTMVEVPLLEVLPKGNMAERMGMRNLSWRSDKPATLYWVEALDQGDPAIEAEYRDELFVLDAPFDGEKRSLIKMQGRLDEVLWGNERVAIVTEYWWNTRNQKTHLIQPDRKDQKPRLLFDRNYQDRYTDPGRFALRPNQAGRDVLEIEDDALFLIGSGFSPEGVRPFVDRLSLENAQRKRLWQAEGQDSLEEVVALRDLRKGIMLTRIQAKDRYPNLYLRTLDGSAPKEVTRFKNPFLSLSGVKKELLRYRRDDGVDLSATLYYPVAYEAGKRYPMIMWAYPREFKDKGTAGQITTSAHRFIYPYYGSPIYWVSRGYMVLDGASFPILGEGDVEPNDSFISQLVANARAAIDAVDKLGLIDRRRVAVGGHSYGAFMTANLLSHSDLFAAGIARSGAYNRSLTPFGFQNEERNFWEAQDIYIAMSPFMHAHKMKTPLLLIHGAADNNPGTHTMQSERYFNALKGLGATVRLVLLPHESHGYAARESILHMLWEQDQWLEKYVRNRVISE